VQWVVWNRKFLRSRDGEDGDKSKQLFGLAPTKSQDGDLICILFGYSLPVILREAHTENDLHYELIREAYVQDMIDEEAFSEKPEFSYDDYEMTR
jgi:hypothetical protein